MAGCQSEAVRTVDSYSVDMLIHIGSFYCQAVFNKTVVSKMLLLLFQCLLEEYFPDCEGFQVGSVMAVLAVIGGIDGRLRLGGQVIHEEYGEGTVTRITPKGRITVQFHEMRTCRVCLLSHLKPVCVLLLLLCLHTHQFFFFL